MHVVVDFVLNYIKNMSINKKNEMLFYFNWFIIISGFDIFVILT